MVAADDPLWLALDSLDEIGAWLGAGVGAGVVIGLLFVALTLFYGRR